MVVVDNLVNSNRKSLEVVEKITGVSSLFIRADIHDTDTLEIFSSKKSQPEVSTLCWSERLLKINPYPSCLL